MGRRLARRVPSPKVHLERANFAGKPPAVCDNTQ
jgi:hypothetical protein